MEKLLTYSNVDTCDEKGNTLLMVASFNGNEKMCNVLLKKIALVDKQNHNG